MPSISEDAFVRVYNATWQNIAREDSNIASRIAWASGLSTGLFAAISFITPRINDVCNGRFWPPLVCFSICCMASLAIFFCFRTKLGVEAAHLQIAYLRQHYLGFADDFKNMCLPRPFGDSATGLGRKSSAVYPNALLVFWALIFVASLGGTVWSLARAADSNFQPNCEMTPGRASRAVS